MAIPGLTDAHLHLVQAAIATRQVDLSAIADAGRRPRSGSAAHAAPSRPGRLAGGPRLGQRPMGRLADGRRPRDGRARATGRDLGTRPSRAVGEPRRARVRPGSRCGSDDPAGGVVRRRRRWLARRRAARDGDAARHGPRPATDRGRPGGGDHRRRPDPAVARRGGLPRPGRGGARSGAPLLVPGLRATRRCRPTAGPGARLHAR